MSAIVGSLPAALTGLAGVGSLVSNAAYFVPMLVAAIAYFNYDVMDPESRPINVPTEELWPQYDFIIIGAGSAGAVLANRLSEVADWNILLLEAGGDETEISDVPSLAGYLQLSDMDWQYKTSPPGQDNILILDSYQSSEILPSFSDASHTIHQNFNFF